MKKVKTTCYMLPDEKHHHCAKEFETESGQVSGSSFQGAGNTKDRRTH